MRSTKGLQSDVMASLDYVEACAHETMRLKPVAPFQVPTAEKPSSRWRSR